MAALLRSLSVASHSLRYVLGGAVVAAAIAAALTGYGIGHSIDWLFETVGAVFLVLLSGLLAVAVFSWRQVISDTKNRRAWFEAGQSAASGVATLALTFTLFGISLGIGSLATQDLSPQTVQPVIRELTAKFSLAFYTTVIGLPLAALLRSLLTVTWACKSDD